MIRKSQSVYKYFLRVMKKMAKCNSVLDVGTSKRFAKEMKYVRHLFGDNYKALGYKPDLSFGEDNCDFDGDIMNLNFKDRSYEGVICLEVIEHVKDPFKSVQEIHRILKPGGQVLLSAPFLTSYHGKSGKSAKHTEYPDYFRYTHQGLELLFKDFSKVEVTPVGGPLYYFLMLMGFHKVFLRLPFLQKIVDSFDKPRKGKATIRHLVYAIK